jgi:hypothetical protein
MRAGPLQVRDTSDGIEISWQREIKQATSWNAEDIHAQQAQHFVNLITVQAESTPLISFDAIDAEVMKTLAMLPSTSQQKQALNESGEWMTVDVPLSAPALPDAPATIVREGRLNGTRYFVIGISPVYTHAGFIWSASAFSAQVRAARIVDHIMPAYNDYKQFIESERVPQPAVHIGDAWRIQVSAMGMQRLSGEQLAAAGVPMNRIPIQQLHIRHRGDELSIEVIDAGMDGFLNPDDEVRFFALQPGDRWNSTDTFWLTLESSAGARMSTQPAIAFGPATRIAIVRGIWQRDSVYDSLLPGTDADHWFSGRLDVSKPAINAMLHSALPFAAGNVHITVNGSSVKPASLQLAANGLMAQLSPAPLQAEQNTASTNWAYVFTVPALTGSTELAIQVSGTDAALALEDVQWRAAASLAFGQRGAMFESLPGNWTYQLDSLPASATLYNVTDWQRPLKVPLHAAAQFSSGPAPQQYVLAGEGTLFTPAISKRTTADLKTPANARAIYIAPAALHSALQPLIAHRLATGWRAVVIDTQAIYDQWTDGQISPDAIRAFLRYARATWRVKPYAVILVGDGNYDPLNNTGNAPPTWVPPFLADVDRQMGETACESCFVQLDGNDPLSDKLPDLMFGRLPVKSAAELTAVVNKIIDYEKQPAGAWMSRNAFIADNTRHADGTYDNAGDFEAFTRRGMAMQPLGVAMPAVLYEPLANGAQPWQEPDADNARNKVATLLNDGAAVVNFTGHGLTNQWAFTSDKAAGAPYLLTTQDAAMLNNGSRLPVVLSMACLTGSFHLPSAGGNSIDEQMVLAPNGGAIASWSSAGLGILFSYEYLQRGFYNALWQNPGALTIGALAQASLLDMFQNAPCCDEPLRTHALLGDPLTPLRIRALPTRLYLPDMSR